MYHNLDLKFYNLIKKLTYISFTLQELSTTTVANVISVVLGKVVYPVIIFFKPRSLEVDPRNTSWSGPLAESSLPEKGSSLCVPT